MTGNAEKETNSITAITRTIKAVLSYLLLYLTMEGIVWQYMSKEERNILQGTKIENLLEKLPFQ